jgi:tetratricopeptide (TPR) repeat protein
LIKTEQPDEALEILQKLHKSSTENYFDMLTLQLLIRKVLILMEAFKDFTDISDHPKIKEDKTFLRVIQYILGGINNDILKHGIKKFDDFSDQQVSLSDLISQLKVKSGMKKLDEFYRNNPTTSYLSKAIILTFKNMYEQALECANTYAELSPQNEIFVVSIRANCLYAMGKFEEALEHHYTTIKLWPSVADYYNLIVTLIKLNRLNELEEVLNTAYKDFPDEILEMLNQLAIEMFKRKNFEASIIIFKNIAETSKKSYAYTKLVIALEVLNRFQEASVIIDIALSIDPDNYEMWTRKYEIYLKLEKLDELVNISEKLIELKPNDIRSDILKTRLLEIKGNFKEALDLLLEIKEKIPNYAEIYYRLSLFFYNVRRFEEVIVNAKKYIEICDTILDHSIFAYLGKAQIAIGEYQEAIESLQKCCQYDPKNFENIYALAVVFSIVEEFDNALLYSNKALEIQPKNAEVLEFKEHVTKELGDLSMSKISENRKNENGFYNVNKKNFTVLNKVNRSYFWNFKNMLPIQKVFSSMNIMKIMRFIKKIK